MVAIIDYGVGNLFSLRCSLEKIGANVIVTSNPEIIKKAAKIILPGVGAFGDAINKLRQSGLDSVIKNQVKSGKDLLGICLGMQLLFQKSYEYGEYDGLGLLKGNIVPISDYVTDLKIPHIGWNALNIKKTNKILKYLNENDCVYFVHSYFAVDCEDSLIATTEYGENLTAAVELGNIMGCQFHPEKSGEIGLKILKAFCEVESI